MTIVRVDVPDGAVTAIAPLQPSGPSGAGPFLLRADDGERYWCKALNNPQGGLVPITEQLVGRAGALIGAPVCEPRIVRIASDLAGWEFRPGLALGDGCVHGSLAIEPVVEVRGTLDHRGSDDNTRRHAGIFALYDWMIGDDPQWLARGGDAEYFSHDHGFYLPPPGANWTAASLQTFGTGTHQLGGPTNGLDHTELTRLADGLEAVTREALEQCASNIPALWPVSDAELNAFVAFAFDRREPVANRLRALTGTV